jgi:hypothetical protein
MMSIRSSAGAALLIALLVAGCGGSATPAGSADASTGDGNGTDASPSVASTEPGASTGGSGGTAEDAANLGGQLVPPNSSELVKTTTDTYWYVTYDSTDSPETLKSYYEGQIPTTGLKIISTTSTGGSYVWVITRDESGNFGGSVTVAPSENGSGSSVIVAVGSS